MKNLTTIAGEPMIRTLPRPADSNASGDIFGGWVLSQMDIAGAIPATERAGGRVATVAIDAMVFHEPIFVGDVVSLYAEVTKVGRTSLTGENRNHRASAHLARARARHRGNFCLRGAR